MDNSVIRLKEDQRIFINSATEIIIRKRTRGVLYAETKSKEVFKVWFSINGFDLITEVNESNFIKVITEL